MVSFYAVYLLFVEPYCFGLFLKSDMPKSKVQRKEYMIKKEHKILAKNLKFPEGPIFMNDGSIILVEIARGTLSKVTSDGNVEVIANLGGGPNGAAIGPDGQCYVCNNGGFEWEINSKPAGMRPILQSKSYSGGKIQKVNLHTGEFETLYEECNGISLKGMTEVPKRKNLLVFRPMKKLFTLQKLRGVSYMDLI